MSARSKARKRALDTLFEVDLRETSIPIIIDNEENDAEVLNYSDQLLQGVKNNQVEIDALISQNLKEWTLDRIPRVDRNILRIAVYELIHEKGVPAGVVISEAVALAESLSTDESAAFVNGTLSSINKSQI